MDELAIIKQLKEIFAGVSQRNLVIGIGDDAAFFRPRSSGIAAATDLLTEGVHFKRDWSDLYSIGRKAAAANLADIFAMGVPATYLLVAVAFEPDASEGIFDLARGIADEAREVDVSVIGGDLSRSTVLTISIAALGEGDQAITRSGASTGEELFIVDLPGRSLLGLEQLKRSLSLDQQSIDFHRRPKVNYRSFLEVSKVASALCDVSDGILTDAKNLARASKVSIDLERVLLLSHPMAKEISTLAERLELDPLSVILSSGEEHCPLFTAKAGSRPEGAWRIGSVQEANPSGVLLTIDGQEAKGEGFQHF